MERRTLVAVSAAQLAAGLVGLIVAVRRRRHYDLPLLLHGSPAHVGRDAVWMGTAYSAPAPMLGAQLWSTVRLARGDDRAATDLAVLGALMVPGYLAERFDRRHLRHWDLVETPVVLAGAGLAAAMVWAARDALTGWPGAVSAGRRPADHPTPRRGTMTS